jgi:hypothetical protein
MAIECFNFWYPVILGGDDGDTQITHVQYENGYIYMAGITNTTELKSNDGTIYSKIFVACHDFK